MTAKRKTAQPATNSPAHKRMALRCKSVFNCAAKIPIANKFGNVPSAKANIYSPPCTALPLPKAYNEALYTKPQGSQPHNMPTPKQAGTDLIGSSRFSIGFKRFHIGLPMRSICVAAVERPARYSPNRSSNIFAAIYKPFCSQRVSSKEIPICPTSPTIKPINT